MRPLFYFIALGWVFISCSCSYKEGRSDILFSSIPSMLPSKNNKFKHQATQKKLRVQQEILSRYGNPVSYAMAGRKYEVLTNASGYKVRGLASWYGVPFHKKRTSSGEKYNMNLMTAAHKTLPLPTYVSVKNLMNGRKIIVKVNDRGPFYADRLIDLSYAAANELRLVPNGTAPVEIEALTAKGTSQAHYYLQAGAFNSKIFATRLQKKITHLTPSPVNIECYNDYYVVRIGPFSNKKMIDVTKIKLAAHGIPGIFSFLA